jgi:hypothetical protein
MTRFEINQTGAWQTDTDIGHIHDSKLCNSILQLLTNYNIQTIVDFGCGLGDYAKTFAQHNYIVSAFDGNPNTPELTNNIGKVLDLSKSVNLKQKYDCVLSLEVGEHIPKKYEQIFINNICNHANNIIILSWAIEGQGGDGHVNCQNNEYIIKQIESRNFKYNADLSNNLRIGSSLEWFKNTIMIFIKNTPNNI